jgi:hypothetical protein
MCQTARSLDCFSLLIFKAQMFQLHLYKHAHIVLSILVLHCLALSLFSGSFKTEVRNNPSNRRNWCSLLTTFLSPLVMISIVQLYDVAVSCEIKNPTLNFFVSAYFPGSCYLFAASRTAYSHFSSARAATSRPPLRRRSPALTHLAPPSAMASIQGDAGPAGPRCSSAGTGCLRGCRRHRRDHLPVLTIGGGRWR